MPDPAPAASSAVDVLLLGALEVRVDGQPIPVTAAQQRVVLAALALAGGRPVTADRLLVTLWPDAVPATARTALHNIIRRLRASFAEAGAHDLIATSPEGYRLGLSPETVDAERFSGLVQEARSRLAAGQPEGAATAYRRALDLWRGDPLPDLVTGGWLVSEVERLTEAWIAATEEWADVEVATGSPERVLARLAPLAETWPWRESLRARLMLALQAAGRTAEALAEYVRAREQFVDELGVEPGPLLREAHARVLRLDAERVESAPGAWTPLVPAELPAAPAAVVGRGRELAELTASLTEGRPGGASDTPVLWVLSGPAGVGKSSLAAHWARSVADRFPDGQLFVNLRGFDPQGAPVGTEEAVRGFLSALGVPRDQVPHEAEAAFGMYRTLLAGRRLLVVLDNARDAAQVRPLLPAGPGCLAVVTSRHELASLAVTDGARTLPLGLLGVDDAQELLAERLGEGRLSEEPAAVAEILHRCGGLPLALAVAAARVATRMEVSLAALAEQLRAASSLDVLQLGDPRTDLRAVLSWSVDALDEPAGRVLRLLGLSPTGELAGPAVASLAGVPLRDARASLAGLGRANLVVELGRDHISVHDLVREHAGERAAAAETPADLAAAVRRLVDHYLHTAHAATRTQFTTALPFELDPCPAGVTVPSFRTPAEGADWLASELSTLVLVTDLAAETPGLEGHAWRLARTVNGALWDVCQWQAMVQMHDAALTAAQRCGDVVGQADALLGLGEGYTGMEQHALAHDYVLRATDLYVQLGDRVGESDARCTLGRVEEAAGNYSAALLHTQEALVLYRQIEDRSGEAISLNNIGWLHACLGDYQSSLDRCLESLEMYVADQDRAGQAYALDSMGRACQGLGDLPRAIALYTQAADLSEALDLRLNRATTLTHLGEAFHASGDLAAAEANWRTGLEILDGVGHPTAEVLRARLDHLAAAPITAPATALTTGAATREPRSR